MIKKPSQNKNTNGPKDWETKIPIVKSQNSIRPKSQNRNSHMRENKCNQRQIAFENNKKKSPSLLGFYQT